MNRPLLTSLSKNTGVNRSRKLFRALTGIGLVIAGVLGTVVFSRIVATPASVHDSLEPSKSVFSAESMRSKSEELYKYIATFRTLLEPTPPMVVDTGDQPLPVKVFVVGSIKRNMSKSSLTGVVRARHEINLAFRVSGKIKQRYIEVGQRVEKGAILFDLDPEDYGLQLRTAQANLDVAEATVQRAVADAERSAELRRVNANSESEYERVLSERAIAIGQRQSALKQLDLARNQLSYCRLMADEAGVITSIAAEAGQVVTAGFRVAELAQSDELEAVIDIPENRLPKSRPSDSMVRFWSLPAVAVPGKLREISPSADPVTRTFRSRFTLIDPPREVKLGMTATVEWSNASVESEVSIPATAVFERDKTPMVWLFDSENGKLAAKPIRIAMIGDQEVVVSEGLTVGQKIVSAGVQKLDENLTVRAWETLP